MSAPAGTVQAVTDAMRLHDLELEPEVLDWLNSLSDFDYKRVDEVCGMLAVDRVPQDPPARLAAGRPGSAGAADLRG